MMMLLVLILMILVMVLFSQISSLKTRILALESTLNKGKKTVAEKEPVTIAPTPEIVSPSASNEKSTPLTINTTTPNDKKELTKPENKTLIKVMNFFTTGNIIAKLGVTILFFGVIFLLNYASSHGLFPLSLRLISAGILGVALISIGWLLQPKKQQYGLILQGCGIGVLYAITFISYQLYQLIPSSLSFTIFIIITAAVVSLALLQNSKTLIVIAQLGGFLTPIMSAGPHGNELIFFSYYTILNIGIAAVSWFKQWRSLNIIGFCFTFIIAALWGYWQYEPQNYLISQIFLIIFVGIYSVITLLFCQQTLSWKKLLFVENLLILGTPILSFSLQAMLVNSFHYGIAISSLVYAAYYAGLAWFIFATKKSLRAVISETYFYLSCTFVLLAILFAFSQQWTYLLWALMSVVMLWFGCKNDVLIARLFAVCVLFIATVVSSIMLCLSLFSDLSFVYAINIILISIIAILSATLLAHHAKAKPWEKFNIAPLIFIIGTIIWLAASFELLSQLNIIRYSMIYFSALTVFWFFLANKYQWKYLQVLSISIIPLMFIELILCMVQSENINLIDWSIWGVAFITQYSLLFQLHRQNILKECRPIIHACLYGMLILCLLNISIHIVHFDLLLPLAWQVAITGLIPLFSVAVIELGCKKMFWPFKEYVNIYQHLVSSIILAIVFTWTFLTNLLLWHMPQHFLYLPLLNPIDVIMTLSICTVIYWVYQQNPWIKNKLQIGNTMIVNVLLAWGFVWITAMTLRSVQAWAQLPFDIGDLYNSSIAQTSLTIVWSLSSLTIVFVATYKKNKSIWWLGMVILGVTILKLFCIDLANSNTIARIISFISVGIILLVIGYFSPIFGSIKKEQ
jgi:uncharacterized membrane protein